MHKFGITGIIFRLANHENKFLKINIKLIDMIISVIKKYSTNLYINFKIS